MIINVSAGTAALLNLIRLRTDAPPTTAYLLHGSGCLMDCAFCTKARSSTAREERLGRVAWMPFPVEQVTAAIKKTGDIGLYRICLQGIRHHSGIAPIVEILKEVAPCSLLPVSVSASVQSTAEAEALIDAGAERVSINLDAAIPGLYSRLKGGSYNKQYRLLTNCARRWPGRISSHLICGMGESEEELVGVMNGLVRAGVTVGLFAFTPLPGTRMAKCPPPNIVSYRFMQAALFLLSRRHTSLTAMKFKDGRLVSFGLSNQELYSLLGKGEAFQTSGCPGCNRPYYNEKPGGVIYNYPGQPPEPEVEAALALLMERRTDDEVAGTAVASNQ